MTIQRLDHLVLAVQAIADAAASWAGTFDLPAGPPYQPDGTNMLLAFLPLDRDRSGAFIELVQPTDPSHRVARFLAERGEGMFSVSLQVDDLDATVRDLRARGLPVSDPEPGVLPRTRVARIPRDAAHGVALQLIERRP